MLKEPLPSGQDLRDARKTAGIGLGTLAEMIGKNAGHLSRVERGGRDVSPGLVRAYQDALGVKVAATSGTAPDDPPVATVETNPAAQITRLTVASWAAPITSEPGVELGFHPRWRKRAGSVTGADARAGDQMPAAGTGASAGSSESDIPAVNAIQTFRSADRRLGGGHLYATLVEYLYSDVGPSVFGGTTGDDEHSVFATAAAFTEMAGWMAHDMGWDVRARTHFSRSLDLVQGTGDRQLQSHVLASMAHLADHLGQPAQAMRLADAGRTRLRDGPRDPDLEARLAAVQARAAAAMHQPDQCHQLLDHAERSLGVVRQEPASPWVNSFDEAAFASESARCMRRLGELREAQRQAERVVELRPAKWAPRSHAFGKLALVAVLIAQGDVDRACQLAKEILDSTSPLGSYLILQQLAHLPRRLEPYRHNAVVAEFLDHLQPVVQQRFWLHRRLVNSKINQNGVPGADS